MKEHEKLGRKQVLKVALHFVCGHFSRNQTVKWSSLCTLHCIVHYYKSHYLANKLSYCHMLIICRKPRPSRQSWVSRGHRDGKSAQFISFKAASETSFDDGWNSCAQNQTTSTKFGQAVVEQHPGQFELKYCQRDQLQLLGSLSQRKLGVTIRACPIFLSRNNRQWEQISSQYLNDTGGPHIASSIQMSKRVTYLLLQ